MLQIVKQKEIAYQELFDESGKPQFVKPLGYPFPGPLRVTKEEWEELCTSIPLHGVNLFIHAKFTMTASMEPCQNAHVGHKQPDGAVVDYGPAFDLQITIACPSARPKWAIFGPYERGAGRALARAAKYLDDAGEVQFVRIGEQV